MSSPARTALFCVAMAFASVTHADELGTANQALQQKDYSTALRLLSKLAASGNPEAQLRLGEMYWYGEGVGLDRAKGDALFAQAAAKGSADAVAATGLSTRRAARSADIAWWTNGYQGTELTSGQWRCAAPAIPAQSTTNADITATAAAISAWSTCYNGFIDHVSQALPAGKAIPADVLDLMSEPELVQARQHLDTVYARVLASAKREATATIARRDAWHSATQSYALKENARIELDLKQSKEELARDRTMRQTSENISQHRGGATKK